MEGCCVQACSSWLAQPTLSYRTQDHQLRDESTHHELDPLPSLINTMSHSWILWGGIFSIVVPSFQLTLAVSSRQKPASQHTWEWSHSEWSGLPTSVNLIMIGIFRDHLPEESRMHQTNSQIIHLTKPERRDKG